VWVNIASQRAGRRRAKAVYVSPTTANASRAPFADVRAVRSSAAISAKPCTAIAALMASVPLKWPEF
jgi:hypothetical protein